MQFLLCTGSKIFLPGTWYTGLWVAVLESAKLGTACQAFDLPGCCWFKADP